ncbi:aggregation-promoting factor C-terminal-like domain-containing protein [Kineosporia babensis]|uniref:Lytic transglycosylase domain-containing protein n=1 Tax=Kineosporia babensis TaxID=499548 RepID=A0A9X1SXK5_9ACTN|nr:hypothetical protein [Kineosporia babensis]MCD5315280.1 hypothetical protein [Kineosporia babensis]
MPTSVRGETKTYPKRSDLRRAEARAATRRQSSSRPSGGSRPSGAPAGGRSQRPPAPASAMRSAEAARRSSLQARYPVAVAPTPAVLPIPQTDPWRPAGIDMPVPRPVSGDTFRQPDNQPPLIPVVIPAPEPKRRLTEADLIPSPPTAPIDLRAPEASAVEAAEWGLDLTTEPATPEVAPGRRKTATEPRKSGKSGLLGGKTKSTAARLLVMALVVGAEGVAVTQLAGNASPIEGNSGTAAAAFELTAEEIQVQEQEAAEAAAATKAAEEAAAEAEERNTQVKDSSPAKAKAALSQYTQAKAAADRIKAAEERRERALRNAQRDPKSAARVMVTDRGWSSAEFSCLDSLWTKESNWNYQAQNPTSSAYGIPQSLPGSKMASAGSDWRTNPVTQIRWGLDYIEDRYGTPCAAWGHSQSVNWY